MRTKSERHTTKSRVRAPRRLLLLCLLAVFALLAASCTGDTDSDADGGAAPATTAPAADDDMADDDMADDDMADDDMADDDMADDDMADDDMADDAPTAPVTQGPGGEEAVASSEITLSDDEIAQVQAGSHTAALLWHTAGAFTDAVSQGARDAFAELGIEVIAETNASFDAAQQANDVETVMAQNPDIIISLAIGPDAGAAAFRPATEAGVQLVFLSNVPQGYVHGEDYVGIVTDDLAAMGITAANLLGEALGGEGEVGFIFHDAAYYVTNQRDQAFKSWIEINYPGIEIVAEQGLADPAAAEEIAAALLTRHPDLDGIYAPWSAGPADGVLAALRAAGSI